jgi:hypothetical protein
MPIDEIRETVRCRRDAAVRQDESRTLPDSENERPKGPDSKASWPTAATAGGTEVDLGDGLMLLDCLHGDLNVSLLPRDAERSLV